MNKLIRSSSGTLCRSGARQGVWSIHHENGSRVFTLTASFLHAIQTTVRCSLPQALCSSSCRTVGAVTIPFGCTVCFAHNVRRNMHCLRVNCRSVVEMLIIDRVSFAHVHRSDKHDFDYRFSHDAYEGPLITQSHLGRVVLNSTSDSQCYSNEERSIVHERCGSSTCILEDKLMRQAHQPVHTLPPNVSDSLSTLLAYVGIDDELARLNHHLVDFAMKKLVLETKTTLGLGQKVVDTQHDTEAALLKTVEGNVSEYLKAVHKLKNAVDEVSSAITGFSIALQKLTNEADIPVSMRNTASKLTSAASNIMTAGTECKQVLEGESMQKLKHLIEEAKKADNERDKVANEHAVYKESVEKKESKYRKEGKALTESKNYNAEVAKRDQLQSELDAANKKFLDCCETLKKAKIDAYTNDSKKAVAAWATYAAVQAKELKL